MVLPKMLYGPVEAPLIPIIVGDTPVDVGVIAVVLQRHGDAAARLYPEPSVPLTVGTGGTESGNEVATTDLRSQTCRLWSYIAAPNRTLGCTRVGTADIDSTLLLPVLNALHHVPDRNWLITICWKRCRRRLVEK